MYPHHKIDLDEKPNKRFKKIGENFKKGIANAKDTFQAMISPTVFQLFNTLAANLETIQPERWEELKGLADGANIDVNVLAMFSYEYDLAALCSSIIVRTADGSIMHGRNLDFPGTLLIRNITFIGEFYKGGKHIFDALMMAGDVSIYTGARVGEYSITENWR